MNAEVEQYLRRATRGLWGAKRRLVQAELRGVLEDKIWRHPLLGHGEEEATRRALGDLGEARTIARGMSAVHLLPPGLQVVGALALLGAFGLTTLSRGLAQVQAAPLSYTQLACDTSPEGQRFWHQNLTPEQRWQRLHTFEGPSPAARAFCDRSPTYAYEFVDRDSLLAALTAQGVRVALTPPPGSNGPMVRFAQRSPNGRAWRWLTFPEGGGVVPLVVFARNGRQLVSISDFISTLVTFSGQPVKLAGEVNPRVTVGRTSFTLGTDQTPVSANLLRTAALMAQVEPVVNDPAMPDAATSLADPLSSPPRQERGGVRLHVGLPDGTPLGVLVRDRPPGPVVSGEERLPEYLVWVTRVQRGEVVLPEGPTRDRVQVVDLFQDLRAPFGGNVGRRVLLMQLLTPNDLSTPAYLAVPPHDVR